MVRIRSGHGFESNFHPYLQACLWPTCHLEGVPQPCLVDEASPWLLTTYKSSYDPPRNLKCKFFPPHLAFSSTWRFIERNLFWFSRCASSSIAFQCSSVWSALFFSLSFYDFYVVKSWGSQGKINPLEWVSAFCLPHKMANLNNNGTCVRSKHILYIYMHRKYVAYALQKVWGTLSLIRTVTQVNKEDLLCCGISSLNRFL